MRQMAKLCFSVNSCGGEEGQDSFSPLSALSSLRDSNRNLLGAVRLSKDGTIKVDNDKVFRVEDAYFLHPDSCYKVEDAAPRLVIDTDVDAVFAKLCAKYSNVVKLRAPRVVEDNARFTLKLCAEYPEGLRGIFALIRDALSSGAEGFDSFAGAYRTGSVLVMRLVSACGKFIDRYLSWYIKQAAISGDISTTEDGFLNLNTKFFVSSVDGLALLYDEREYGILSLLRAHAKAFPCMSKKIHREFVIAASRVIEDVKGFTEGFTSSDYLYLARRSFANACAASVFSFGALMRDRVMKHLEAFLKSRDGRYYQVVCEALEALAIDNAFSCEDKLSAEDMEKILEVDRDFAEKCAKYEGIASKLQFPLGFHISVECKNLLGADMLYGLLSRYERAYDFTVGKGLYGVDVLGNFLSSKPWNDEQRQKAKEIFAGFCLAEAYFKLLSSTPMHKQVDIISFGDRVVVNGRISGIHVWLHGDVIPADDVLFGKRNRAAIRDIRLRTGNGKVAAFARKYAAVISAVIALVAAVSMVLLVSLPGIRASAVMPWLLVPVSLVAATAVGCAIVLPVVLNNETTAEIVEEPELYLCVNYRSDAAFNTVKECSNPYGLRFSGHSLCVDGALVSHKEYRISLVDANAVLAERCTLLRIQGAEEHREGLALVRALASTAGSMHIAKLSVTEASPPLKDGYVLKCHFETNSREAYIRMAEVFAKAGRPALLLAYLDSYVAVATSEGKRGLSENFLKSDAYKLLCKDQASWRIFDDVLGYCSKYLVGDRKAFVEKVTQHWESNKRPVAEGLCPGMFSVPICSLGFPFDHRDFLCEIERAYKGFDKHSHSFSEEILLNFDKVFHTPYDKHVSYGEAVKCDRWGGEKEVPISSAVFGESAVAPQQPTPVISL